MSSAHLHVAFDQVAKYLEKRVSSSNDSNIGSATGASNSASSLVSTLVPVILVAFVWLIVFMIVRPKAGWKYSPRTGAKTLKDSSYSPPLKEGAFAWLPQLWEIPDTYVLSHNSLDAYLFLRFLKIAVISCIVGCCITFPILFPVNATGGAGMKQLDILSFANVESTWRWWAHAACAWLFFGYIMFMITRESIFYINLRQAYLMSPQYANKLSSRTVLFTAVPDDYLNEAKLRETLGPSVRHIWFPTDVKELQELVDERDKVAYKLEGAETKLVKLANEARLKSIKKDGAQAEGAETVDTEAATGSVSGRWLAPKDRPTHRLKPLIGKKVDTISWSREELERLNALIEVEQAKHRSGDSAKIRAVFVEFATLMDAQAAYQSLTHHQVLTMAPRYTGVHPVDVIWSNLKIRGGERFIRYSATLAFVVALIIFWSLPVAAIGAISNINYLENTKAFHWLHSIFDPLPSFLMGIITGLLPVVLLSLLMSLLPPFLRFMARLGGSPTYSDAEYTVQNYYFAFQIIQVFLVATLGSAASSAAGQIVQDPSSVTKLLSTQIPKASNFYLSYFILQGLGVVSGLLVGIAGLFITPILVKILGSTPRKIFLKWNQLAGVGWGQVFPIMTNLFVIALCYACIAPLVLIFAAIGLFFFYFAYRYNFLYVYDTGVDTKGAIYPRALQQLFVGLYIAEICLFGLMATRLNSHGAIGPFILVVLLLVFTVLYHIALNSALDPLIKYLPKTLGAEERRALLDDRDGVDGNHVEDGTKPGSATSTAIENQPAHKKPNFIVKFLKPGVYNDYATMRRLIPNMVPASDEIEEGLVRDAYLPPAAWSEMPQLVIPRDELGVSKEEIRDTPSSIPITDEGATLNEKGKIIVNDAFMSELYFQNKVMRMKLEH